VTWVRFHRDKTSPLPAPGKALPFQRFEAIGGLLAFFTCSPGPVTPPLSYFGSTLVFPLLRLIIFGNRIFSGDFLSEETLRKSALPPPFTLKVPPGRRATFEQITDQVNQV